MNNKKPAKQTNKRIIIAVILIGVAIIVAIVIYLLVSKTDANNPQVVLQNKDNASTLRAEKNQEPLIIDDKTSIDSQNKKQNSSDDSTSEAPTVDSSGLSTNLNRADIRPAVVAVLAVYQDFLAKLQAVSMAQRQSVADQYIVDNQALFSSSYNYLSSYSLHLFPQSANVEIPNSVSINSAIIDPDDSSQTIVQVFMQPDDSWSLLVYVKMNADGSLGTFEKLVIRNSQNPL